MTENDLTYDQVKWPHRIAVALVVFVFPLIWLGATVTTYAAGMAVPDWPNTYGYNMFLYPITTWLFGPFNLLVEHGHRQLASLAGLIAIALVVVTVKTDRRRKVKWFATGLLALIIFQGILGGVRVLMDDRTLARIHGCVGPAFFALVVGFCVVTSRWWLEDSRKNADRESKRSSLTAFALVMLIISFLQICIGSYVRHIMLDAKPAFFQHLVLMHIGTAFVILLGTLFQWIRTGKSAYRETGIRRSMYWLMVLIVVQIALGLLSWVMKYGWPVWFENWESAARFVIAQKSMLQANIVTGHVAIGSLILAFWMVQFLRCWRVFNVERNSSC